MNTIYLTYINQFLCDSYSIVGSVNGEFFEIDASKRFFQIPFNFEPNQSMVFDVKFSVRSFQHNDNFSALPVFFSLIRKNKKFYKKIYQPTTDNSWFLNNGIKWLGPTDKQQFRLELKVIDAVDETDQALVVNNKKKLISTQFALDNLEYNSNTWMVFYSYSRLKSALSSPISVRIHKDFSVSNINKQDRFNFVTIGKKEIPLQKVYFFKKIYSIWDWMYALRLGHAVYNTKKIKT